MDLSFSRSDFGILNDDVIWSGLTLSRAFIAECAENALRKT